jgi:hypothetical protein
MRFGRLIILGLVVLLAGAAAADDTVTIVLGTGSTTGTVLGASPAATGVGKWLQATGGKESEDWLTFQLSGGASATVAIQTSLDGTTTDTAYTFLASGEIYQIPVRGGVVYRAICTAFTSGSPIVKASVSGKAQLLVLP